MTLKIFQEIWKNYHWFLKFEMNLKKISKTLRCLVNILQYFTEYKPKNYKYYLLISKLHTLVAVVLNKLNISSKMLQKITKNCEKAAKNFRSLKKIQEWYYKKIILLQSIVENFRFFEPIIPFLKKSRLSYSQKNFCFVKQNYFFVWFHVIEKRLL